MLEFEEGADLVLDFGLFDEFHPIEMDENLTIEERSRFMDEWWRKHSKLIVESGLNRNHFEDVFRSSKLVLREGVSEGLRVLDGLDVPFVVLSGSAAGEELISSFFSVKDLWFSNIEVVSNRFIWNEKGNVVSFVEPFIHSFNKSGVSIKRNLEVFSKVRSRKNLVLIGDSIGDCFMADGLDVENVLKVGFLNFDVSKNLESFKRHFDVVICGDSDFSFLVEFFREFE